MALRFLLDEMLPTKLLRTLQARGHDVVKAEPSTPDVRLAERAKREGRILITSDHDFTNRLQYPPSEFTILHIRIHPPEKDVVIDAVLKLLDSTPELRGWVILERSGPLRVLE